MNDFPLAPFLVALQADDLRITLHDYDRIITVLRAGGPWTVWRLRGALMALLVRSGEQEEAFTRRFDTFFELALETPYSGEEIARALENLRGLAREGAEVPTSPPVDLGGTPSTPNARPVEKRPFRPTRVHIVAAALLVVLALSLGAAVYITYFRTTPAAWGAGGGRTGAGEARESSDGQQVVVTESVKSFMATVAGLTQVPVDRSWKDVAGVAALLSLPLFFYFWLHRKFDADDKLVWNPHGPRHFPLSSITDPAMPYLDPGTLDQIADSFGYFQSDRPSKALDMKASVEAAGRHYGLPVLLYQKRRQLRRIYILEDAFAGPLSWNPVSQELAEGLGRRGISVKYGKFYGSPDKFHLLDGTVTRLEDMEDYRGNYMLFIFSDGKSLSPDRDAFLLEALARWPLVAWMELREPRCWDESAALPASYGIPVHHASPSGLLEAMQRFLTERGTPDRRAREESRWHGLPANVGTDLSAHIERLLGDALPWAQACSMLQPITVGMAHTLRRNFLSHVPPERVGRLLLLPGTTQTVAGLRFSVPVLAVLRLGFASHWEEERQEEVIRFILGKIEEVEPAEKESLAHLAWDYTLERVRLELEPDRALERLTQLEKTPLGGAIRAELKNIILPGGEPAASGELRPTRVPLRLKPQSQRALRQLAHFAPGVGFSPAMGLNGVGDELRRFLRALLRVWGRLRGLPRASAARLSRLLDKARTHSKGGETVEGDDVGGLVATPPRLIIKRSLRRGERHLRLPHVRVAGGVELLTANIFTDSDWLRVEDDRAHVRTELPLARGFERLLRVAVKAEGLQSGRHAGNVTVSAAGAELAIPVELTVSRRFRERLALWWEENRRAWRIRLAAAAVLLVAATYYVSAALQPNWINRLYNSPPVLKGLNLSERTLRKDERLELSADAVDPDGDQLRYGWETKDGAVDGRGPTAFLSVAGHEPSAEEQRARVTLNLDLTDSRGGRATYRANLDLETNEVDADEKEEVVTSGAESVAGGADQAQEDGLQPIVNDDSRESMVVSVRGLTSKYSSTFVVRPLGRRVLRLAPGDYIVSIRIGDSPVGDDRLEVTPGANEEYGIGPTEYELTLYSNVPGGKLFIDGEPRGSLRKERKISLPEGQYMFEVRKPGYKTWKKEVVVDYDAITGEVDDEMVIEAALTDINVELELDPGSELYKYYEKAQEEVGRGRYDEALRIAEQGLAKDSHNGELKVLRDEIQHKKSLRLVPAQVREEVEADYVTGAEAFGDGVRVTVLIDSEGKVFNANAPGYTRRIGRAAIKAALLWKFEPARTGDSVPTYNTQIITVKFKPRPSPTPTP